MTLVQPYFCHESLGHRIKLSYPHLPKYYGNYNFRGNDVCETVQNEGSSTCDRAEVRDLVEQELGDAELMVLLGYDEDDFVNGKFRRGTTGYGNTGCGVFKPELQN